MRLILFLALMGAPGLRADDAIRSTQRRLGMAVTADGAPKQELMLALAEAGNRAASGQVPSDWKSQDYDALYALLQQYREELKALGLKNLDAQLNSLKAKSDELELRLAKTLHPLDGLKIHGKILTEIDTLMLSGPGKNGGAPLRYFVPAQHSELNFDFTRGLVSAEAELDMLWLIRNDTVSIAPRRLLVEMRLPVAIEAGDIDARMTPLTLWRNEDEDPEEAPAFAAVKTRLKDQLHLKDGAWPLRALRASTDVVIGGSPVLKLEALGSQIGDARSNARSQPVYQPNGGLPWKTVYNTYLGAWKAEVPMGGFSAAYHGVIMRDAYDSAMVTYLDHPDPDFNNSDRIRGFDNQVHSLGAAFELPGVFISNFEAAQSAYSNPNNPKLFHDPDVGEGYLIGRALLANMSLKLGWLSLSGNFREAGDGYVSPASQGRTWDASGPGYGPLAMDNASYDPSTDNYSNLPLPNPAETYYNHRLLPPQVIATQNAISNVGFFNFDTLLPYDPAINAGTPYGMSTPNRRGFGGRMALRFFEGIVEPSVRLDMSQQQKSIYAGQAPERYSLMAAGLKSDWSSVGLPMVLSFGYRLEDTKNDGYVAFSSALLQAGIDAKMGKHLDMGLAWRHLDFNGSLLPYVNTAYNLSPSRFGPQDQSYDQSMARAGYQFSETVRFDMLYTIVTVDDLYARTLDGRPNYTADQAYGRFEIVF